MKIAEDPASETWAGLSQRPQIELGFLESSVRNIINRVKKSGDQALRELTAQYDKAEITELRVSAGEISDAERQLSADLKKAIQTAHANISKFHAAQKREVMEIETTPGVRCWRKAVAITNVGIYIPGGSAPLFSTVLM